MYRMDYTHFLGFVLFSDVLGARTSIYIVIIEEHDLFTVLHHLGLLSVRGPLLLKNPLMPPAFCSLRG